MIESIFGLTPNINIGNHYYTIDHLIMVLVMIVFAILMLVIFLPRSEHVKKVMCLFSCIALFILQVCKFVYRGLRLSSLGQPLNFWEVTGFDLSSVVTWLVIPIAISVIFSKRETIFVMFGNAFVFSVGATSAILFMIIPYSLESGYAMYHSINIITILTNFLLLFLGFYMGLIDFLKFKVNDLWFALMSLVVLALICLILYYVSGQTLNLLFMKYNPIFEYLNFNAGYPATYFISLAVFFIIQLLLYVPIMLYAIKLRKKD